MPNTSLSLRVPHKGPRKGAGDGGPGLPGKATDPPIEQGSGLAGSGKSQASIRVPAPSALSIPFQSPLISAQLVPQAGVL